jgi:hypothetical protein
MATWNGVLFPAAAVARVAVRLRNRPSAAESATAAELSFHRTRGVLAEKE